MPSPKDAITAYEVSYLFQLSLDSVKWWSHKGYIHHPTKYGKHFKFFAENCGEVLIMRILCYDFGIQAKVASRVARSGVVKELFSRRAKGEVEVRVWAKFNKTQLEDVGVLGAGEILGEWGQGGVLIFRFWDAWGEAMARQREGRIKLPSPEAQGASFSPAPAQPAYG